MKKLLFTLLFMTGFSLAGQSQNSIDRLVEKHSTTGESVFTSAIEREPASQKVIKVVKMFDDMKKHVRDMNASPFIAAFENESRHANSKLTHSKDKTTLVLTTESKDNVRIYMLKYDPKSKIGIEVTIIVKPNK